mgnify:CR=1 FL=1
MENRYKEYTNRELEFIAKLKKQGKTNQYIADATGRPYEGIKSVVTRLELGNPPPPLTEFEKAIIMSGDSPMNIAKIVGRTNTQVSRIRYRLKKKGYKINHK